MGANPLKEKISKSFVIRSGKVEKSAAELIRNIRKVLEPHTASKLRERATNRLKDFLAVAGPLGVTHAVILSQTDVSTNVRFAKIPHGPTLCFKISSYTLMRDILSQSAHPKSPGLEYATPPILIMNNFSGADKHHNLILSFFQNLFPPLDVANMKLAQARRVLLLSYVKEADAVEFRHYNILVKPTGVSKSIKKILNADLPNLENVKDVSDFILNNASVSDSEGEDAAEMTVTLPQDYLGKNKRLSQRKINLIEIGPRFTMQLYKIQDGFCDGKVLHHSYIEKTPEQVKSQEKLLLEKTKLKERRRAEQDENVRRKQAAKNRSNKNQAENVAQDLSESEAEDASEISDSDFLEEFEE